MRRNRLDDLEAESEAPPEDISFADIVEIAARKIVTAIVIAGGLIALAIYFRPSPPRYQAAVGDGRIVRVDTRSGGMIACEGGHCYRVLRRGEDLDDAPAARTDEPDCGVRPRIRLDYRGGLTLTFQAGRFVAWGQDAGAGYAMRSGIAIESPRAALRALGPVALHRVNVTDVPLEQFTAGPVGGVLLGGKVRDLTAGESACR
jgi:hypothetical protein